MCLSGLKHTFILFILLYLDLCWSRSVVERCQDICESSDNTGRDETLECIHGLSSCRRNRCGMGCELWRSSLQTSCLDVCVQSDLHILQVDQCVAGCNSALDVYAKDINVLFGNLTRPVLVAGSKTNETVILDWLRPPVKNVTYILQKLYLNLSEKWEQHIDIEWISLRQILVTNLHPYVTYMFRMVVVASPQHTVISPESVPIATKEYGPPTGVPIIISLSTSSSSVHLKWKPPYFLNAKLLGYTLTTVPVDDPGTSERINEIDVHDSEIVSEVITVLKPDTRYTIRVAARNRFGIGPIVERRIRTKPRHTVKGTSPFLLFGTDNKIKTLDLEDIFDIKELYQLSNESNIIKGVAIHYERKVAYFVDSEGTVHVFPIQGTNVSFQGVDVTAHAQLFYHSNGQPQALSIDWLNNYLYIAEEDQIIRCYLDDDPCINSVVVNNMSSQPEDLSVDPCNGYLFWVQQGEDGGLYRLDLADLSSNQPISRPLDSRIVIGDQMMAFTVDYPNFRIFFPDETRNSLMSVYLDGTDLRDIRKKVEHMQFINVHSMVLYSGLLYWTNGRQTNFEEYDPFLNQYVHNQLFIPGNHFAGFNVWHPSSQPRPVPLMPPKNLEILFSEDSVILSWEEPDIDQGRGAWHSWLYEVEEVDHHISPNGTTTNITGHTLHVRNLIPNRLYSFRARAYSQGGYGPWSVVVNGTTLRHDLRKPYILYLDNMNICSINLDGTDQHVIQDLSQYNNQLIDVETYGNLQFFTLNNGSVVMQSQGQQMKILSNIQGASVLAYDWLANTLYWSSPRHNMIQRLMLDQDHHREAETIHQGALSIQDIALDSEEGYIYWTTSYTIEMSRLSGRGHHIIHNLPRFSGRYILGLAIDLQADVLYWVLKNGETIHFFHMALLHQGEDVDPGDFNKHTESTLERGASFPSLQYYSNKLFWVSEPDIIAVQDIRGKSVASLHVLPSGELIAFTVVHDGKGHRPGSKVTNQSGIPPAINLDTIFLNGRARTFVVSWAPVQAEDGKRAFYHVEIEYQNEPPKNKVLDYPNVTINYIEAYTNFTLTVTPCTEWGCNYTRPNQKQLLSPESVPTVPTRPRKYVTFHRHYLSNTIEIEVEFRWSRPSKENGKIIQYKVQQAADPGGPWRTQPRTNPKRRHHTINGAKLNTTYYFKVSACTRIGCGPMTDVVQVNTADEKPVPMLLALDSHMLGIFYIDDNNYQKNLAKGNIVSLTYIAQEDTFYWINDSKQIVRMNGLNNTGEERIVDTDSTAKGLTADWIGRNLYWLEDKPAEENRIMKYSLSEDNSEPEPVLKRQATLWQVAVDPYRSSLFWTEYKNGTSFLMKCRLDGLQIRTILWHHNSSTSSIEYRYKNEDRINTMSRTRGLKKPRSRSRHRRKTCNCPGFSVGQVFVMDHTQVENTEIYVVDNATGSIWATDEDGCNCRLVVDALLIDYGLPPDSLTVDLDRLYWTNKAKTSVNSVLKTTGSDFVKETMIDTPIIMAYGKHLQPMPDPECLLVGNYTDAPQAISTKNTSLTLGLSPWYYDESCSHISLPAVKYTLLYRVMKTEHDYHDCRVQGLCARKGSYDPNVILSDLRPDTLYQVQAMVSNVYTGTVNYPGPHGIFRTKKGIPSAPHNVLTRVMNPRSIEVWWQLPLFLNGPKEDVNYVVEWSFTYPNGTGSGGSNNIIELKKTRRDNRSYYTTRLNELQPNTTYIIRVLAYDAARTGFSASNVVSNVTFLLPENLIARAVNGTTVELQWTPPADSSVVRHTFMKSETMDEDDFSAVSMADFTEQKHPSHTKLVQHLEASRQYYFMVTLLYRYEDILQTPPVACTTPVGPPSKPDPPGTTSTPKEMLVQWVEPYDGGSPVECYILEYRHEDSFNWTQVYNGSATQWVVINLPTKNRYMFRVAAINAMGVGEYSDSESLAFQPYTGLHNRDRLTMILASSFGVIIVLIFIAVIILVIGCRHYKENKQIPFNIVPGNRNSPDMELATLRELPRVTVQTSNALYAINSDNGQPYSRWRCNTVCVNGIIPTDEDVAALPHFRRDQLTLTKFLGSGAFGEVFEGIARNILTTTSGETRVAVKTLRKGATDQEKEEFLKEALLMSNFKYDFILRLLGVCLDNDPQFIILELMEGGDLLSYLRSSRPTPSCHARLNLPDMVGICVDVSMGCRHLEDMHFVHRDLAARNCLVSSRMPEFRVVKIGDFGLARDIYKNDYYRKEGEGLLPVRWMSPESLIDGVFTTQSDVWAFGVLMWEVLTLGQQPYPARTNLEVLHFVRSGGRLDRPDNCPDDMYHLMLKCWCYSPDERPSFTYILSQLEGFKRQSLDPSSEFSGKNGDLGGIPVACSSRVYHDDITVIYALANGQLQQQATGINGTVKLPPIDKKDGLWDCARLSNSSLSSHKGEQQDHHYTRRSPSNKSIPSDLEHNGSHSNREDEHGYLEPLSIAAHNHKYLELIGSTELNKSDRNMSANNNTLSRSPVSPPGECFESPVGATANSPPLFPSVSDSQSGLTDLDHKNGYAKTPTISAKDPKTGQRVYYSQIAQNAPDSELECESDNVTSKKVRTPYRGPHSQQWHEDPNAIGITVFRDIAGRSVPQPQPKSSDT